MTYDPNQIEAIASPGESRIFEMPGRTEATIAVHATDVGASALVEFSISSLEALKAGVARWVVAAGLGDNGVVTQTAVMDVIPSAITAVRITNVGSANVAIEVRQ